MLTKNYQKGGKSIEKLTEGLISKYAFDLPSRTQLWLFEGHWQGTWHSIKLEHSALWLSSDFRLNINLIFHLRQSEENWRYEG